MAIVSATSATVTALFGGCRRRSAISRVFRGNERAAKTSHQRFTDVPPQLSGATSAIDSVKFHL
jgi:hypothetical protein